MSNPSNPLLRQDAHTNALLGVDFVPMPTRPARGTEVQEDDAGTQDTPQAKIQPSGEPDERARREAQMARLRARYERDAPHDQFVTAHTKIVWGDGDVCARLMFVGEAPGADEDRQGIPFVGRAGQLLNKMIAAMGLSREQVYIANVLKTRPPGNATPTSEEAQASAPYLYGQIGIVRPEAIVTLGLPATRLLLDTNEAMGRMRGHWRVFRVPEGFDPEIVPAESVGFEVPVMPTYHPAYLLRSYTPENRAKVWSDLQQVMERLGLSSGA